ncbi:UNVERIFIED_CONTAM: F-box/LRR-repeat protein 3 [Sesamum radiatum]|uniref:F-box/LRR-repeat protein 3 n=1 Tax=Sesamum radiatum TaxID=300843 RepID=A0AAW2R651_SESRA
MKKQKLVPEPPNLSRFDLLSEEIVFIILDFLNENPLDKKAFSLVCRSFYAIESRHRKFLKPLRSEHLTKVLNRYPHVSTLDLSLCPRITDASLGVISGSCKEMLRSINLSRSKFFSHVGLSNLALNCRNLVEIDLSNATELKDLAAAAIAEAKNLERLWLVRCKSITDIGIGCIAVGCRKLRLLSLKWCLGVGDLGVGLIAVKCKDMRSLDLSYLPVVNGVAYTTRLVVRVLDPSSFRASISFLYILLYLITNKCLSQILELQNLEDLVLEGCFGIDDDSLTAHKLGCKSLETLDMSSCQNVSHVGLSSLTSAAGSLRQLILSYGSRVDLALADSLQKLSMLQSIKLDGCQVTSSGLKAIGTAEAFVLIGQRCQLLEELDLTDNEIDDEGLKSISRCSRLSSLKLGICLNITDQGLIHIGLCCTKLKELDLYRSAGITDSSISAIARGCSGIEMINIAYCKFISDRSFMSLAKCPKLKTLESRGCPLITSLGLAAVAVGCKQLAKLDIKKCHSIDDAGMIPLAHFSQNLKQINLSYTSVTDVGLLSLASISCLQSMTVLHLEGLTPSGLAAALLACGGLTKVKLQASFKSALPQLLFEHLEARGCTFQWREKIFRAELDPKCWKLQLADAE